MEDDQEDEDENENDGVIEVIIVTTVDGTLAGLDKRTGRLLWKRSGNGKEDADTDAYTHMNSHNSRGGGAGGVQPPNNPRHHHHCRRRPLIVC